MPRPPKRPAIEVFELVMYDARALVAYAGAFKNQRSRRMRLELRQKIGESLRIPIRDRESLDCLESGDLFVVFLPTADLDRSDFADLRALLRQAIVAACAALESYIGERAYEFIGPAVRAADVPKRLRGIPTSVGEWIDTRAKYANTGWGLRRVVEQHIGDLASSAPSKVGQGLSTIGVSDWAKKVDVSRSVASGTTVAELEAITQRRNRIVHAGDRHGSGRSALTIEETSEMLRQVESVAHAIDDILDGHSL